MQENVAVKYQRLQDDFQRRIETGRLGNLTLSDFMCIGEAGKELLRRHAIHTAVKAVADYYQGFGFLVTMDFDGVNYVIAE